MSRGKPLSFDRNEVLQKALGLLWRKGYEATGLTELLEHMGIQRQSFYNTFGSKEELLFEAIGAYGEMVHLVLSNVCSDVSTPFEKIDRLFLLWTDMEASGCFYGNCVAEFGTTHDKVAQLMEAQLKSVRSFLGDIFQEAIDRGDLPAERDAQVLATVMLTYSQGLALMSKTTMEKDMIRAAAEVMMITLKQ